MFSHVQKLPGRSPKSFFMSKTDFEVSELPLERVSSIFETSNSVDNSGILEIFPSPPGRKIFVSISSYSWLKTPVFDIPKTMRAVVYRGVNDLRLETVPVPETGDEELLVQVGVCGVCPTDIK